MQPGLQTANRLRQQQLIGPYCSVQHMAIILTCTNRLKCGGGTVHSSVAEKACSSLAMCCVVVDVNEACCKVNCVEHSEHSKYFRKTRPGPNCCEMLLVALLRIRNTQELSSCSWVLLLTSAMSGSQKTQTIECLLMASLWRFAIWMDLKGWI